jgi:hypothetical protein
MTVLRSRIGERRRQDADISIALMVEFQKRLEAKWQDAVIKNYMGLTRETAEDGAFFLFTYGGSLRGYETPKISSRTFVGRLFLLRRPMKQRRKYTRPPHVSLPLEGRFKARSQSIQRRIIDTAWETHS